LIRGHEFLTCGIRARATDKLKTCRHGRRHVPCRTGLRPTGYARTVTDSENLPTPFTLRPATWNTKDCPGIDMLTGATNATISGLTVLNSAYGLRAAGVLTGSIVTKSTFDGLGRAASNGALLSGAQGLKLGLNTTSYNTFQNSAVGMTATSTSTGTKVFGNQFIGNSRYGISLAAATGLQIGSSTDLSLQNMISGGTNTTIGVFASGFCTGSSVNKMRFASNFTGTKYSVAQSRNLIVVQ